MSGKPQQLLLQVFDSTQQESYDTLQSSQLSSQLLTDSSLRTKIIEIFFSKVNGHCKKLYLFVPSQQSQCQNFTVGVDRKIDTFLKNWQLKSSVPLF